MAELIPGVEFAFPGRTLIIPPLTIGALQRLQQQIAELQTASALSPEFVSTVVDVTHCALQRNYPSLTRDEVAGLLDVGNMHDVVACVLDVGGLKRKAQAEGNALAQAVQTPALTGLG